MRPFLLNSQVSSPKEVLFTHPLFNLQLLILVCAVKITLLAENRWHIQSAIKESWKRGHLPKVWAGLTETTRKWEESSR